MSQGKLEEMKQNFMLGFNLAIEKTNKVTWSH
jgi:hypothetical protein